MAKDRKPPAFQFYVDDFSSDGKVEAMTTEEVGAYILLLCKAWREEPAGSIPNNDRALARWTRLAPDRWAECRTAVLAAFELGTDNKWHQKRMRREYEKLRAFGKTRHNAAQTAARARWENAEGMRDACVTDASGMREACTSLSSSSSPSENSNNQPTARAMPLLADVLEWAKMDGVAESDAEAFWNHFEASGWIDKNGNRIVNARAKLKTWSNRGVSSAAERRHHGKTAPEANEIKENIIIPHL